MEKCIDSFRPERDHIEGIRANVNFLHRKIIETEEEDVDHNIRTVTKYKLDDMLQHKLRDHEVAQRQQRMINLYRRWNSILDGLLRRIKADLPAIRKRIKERKLEELLLQDLFSDDEEDEEEERERDEENEAEHSPFQIIFTE